MTGFIAFKGMSFVSTIKAKPEVSFLSDERDKGLQEHLIYLTL